LTPENIRLGLYGLAAGAAIGLAWRAAGRLRWGGAPFVLAVFGAARYAGRSDWFGWSGMVAAGVVVTVLAGAGSARLLAAPGGGWRWTAVGSLVSAAGVWAGVPETGPALLAGGALTGLAAVAVVTGSRWAPTAGLGAAGVIGWAALSGAAGRPWAALGGALCTGLAPWLALVPPVRPGRGRHVGPPLLAAHTALVAVAARWIGVTPAAGWGRVTVVAAAGLAVAIAARWRA